MAIRQRSATKVMATYLILCAIAFLMLFPLLWLIGTSFKSPTEDIFTFPPQIFPSQPTLRTLLQFGQPILLGCIYTIVRSWHS